jgi:hypothetical protein
MESLHMSTGNQPGKYEAWIGEIYNLCWEVKVDQGKSMNKGGKLVGRTEKCIFKAGNNTKSRRNTKNAHIF